MKAQLRLIFLLVILMISVIVCGYANAEDLPTVQAITDNSSTIQTTAGNLPTIQATAAVLIDSKTGDVLFAKNFNRNMAPASTTKIMTAIIAIEKGNLDRKVVISRTAAAIPGSSMHLRRGEVQTLRNLLFGLLLSSGNDAATAIAETIAGTEKKFALMMNAKAHELGMFNTNFKNASGLPAVGHYTTAYDLALLARYALENPIFSEIVKTKTTTVPRSRSKRPSSLTNHNKLLWQYPYTTGIKTGYTRAAGKCLVASATQNDVTLISVVLKSDIMYNDSIKLLDFGFGNLIQIEKPTNGESLDITPTNEATINTDSTTNAITVPTSN